ncbi:MULTISPECIES: MFS transporter [unclassified Brevundimonas]|uniref:MFS transporter n=1 Tax=unclassified Brevundimonas TaxID=2622653 RepID=UPI0025B8517B|nr:MULTISPECIES: MFS transporter [unclassified Brevundimonas]
MQGLDSTAIVPALPRIAEAFQAPELAPHILLAAYFIGCGASLPVIGWASDRFGARRVLLVAIAVFVLAGIASALAPGLMWLTASRFVQGAAAATLMPVARMLAVRTAPPQALLGIITALTAPAMAGQTLGPALGGLLAAHEAWRGIFLVGVPFAVCSLGIVALIAPDARREDCGRLDWVAMVMGVLAMTAAVAGLGTMRDDGPPVYICAAFVALAAGLGTLFVRRNLASDTPLIDFRVLADPTFRRCFRGGLLFRLLVGGTPFVLAYHFQSGLSLDALTSGLLITASGAGALLVKPFTARIIGHLGYRPTLLWAGGASVVLFLLVAFADLRWPLVLIAGVLVAGSFVRSLQVTTFGTLCYADLPARSAGSASVLSSIAQQLSHALGVAIAAGAMAAASVAGAPPSQVSLSGFLAIAIGTGLCLPVFWRLSKSAGSRLL